MALEFSQLSHSADEGGGHFYFSCHEVLNPRERLWKSTLVEAFSHCLFLYRMASRILLLELMLRHDRRTHWERLDQLEGQGWQLTMANVGIKEKYSSTLQKLHRSVHTGTYSPNEPVKK